MPDLNVNQTELQFGFTKGLSPIMAALIVSEGILHAKQQKKNLYPATIDSQKAFDVVHHMILLEKLYFEVPADVWKVIQNLYSNMSTEVKWNNHISKRFPIKQGGVQSTHFHKSYINDLRIEIEKRALGLTKELEYWGSPLCADDIVLMSTDETEIQAMLDKAYKYSCEHSGTKWKRRSYPQNSIQDLSSVRSFKATIQPGNTTFEFNANMRIKTIHIKTIRCFQSLPISTSTAAVYMPIGAIPIEAELHKRQLSLLYSILVSENTKLRTLMERQLIVNSKNPESFFARVQEILQYYSLMPIHELIINLPTKFQWKKVIFSLQIINGGYLKYIDRDTDPNPEYASHIRVKLNGRNVTREFIIQWDIHEPYHQCVQENGSKCTSPPVSVDDVTNKSVIHIEWNSWVDDLSTIDSYSYEVFELGHNGIAFSERTKISEVTYISKINEKSNFTVTSQGMYSVVFTAVDKAGNEKSCRVLFLYDNSSAVEVNKETHIIIKQSSKSSNNVWVDVDDPIIDVQWPDKFKNERHHKNMWLDNVLPRLRVDSEYDDHYGIVRFETKFTVYSPNVSQHNDFNVTKSVLDESASLSVAWNDGDMLIVTVRAFDIFEFFEEDTVTVYKDASPPEIRNLWLTRRDRVNISVHSIEDFSKMMHVIMRFGIFSVLRFACPSQS
ncbi:unnamed protein product [Mytilus coruscus]|uniref:Reverse transcriptase domain-containing protein n=1 Tax=Mytilus coruscus TaxID=42192 RepID=A0A6J8BWN2_MYTCO|nr:unnamed protein product [Mytilus coruscus]